MFSYVQRSLVAIGVVVAVSSFSVAQYGGGGMGGGATGPGYNPNRSYGSKGAIIGAVAGGAALAGGLLYWKHHKQTKLLGCVAGDGDKLVSESDDQTYSLSHQPSESLKAGERVELLGKKIQDNSGEPRFEVKRMSRDLGKCSATSAQQ